LMGTVKKIILLSINYKIGLKRGANPTLAIIFFNKPL
jgi:hypothetical protein